jgi:hypothetical protein
VRAKTFVAPQNTPEQRQLARTAYLAPCRAALRRAWRELRALKLVPAARSVASAADHVLQYAATAIPASARRIRSGGRGTTG